MDDVEKMNDDIVSRLSMIIAIPDEHFRQQINAALATHYAVEPHADLSNLGDSSPALVLCHQQFFEGESAHNLADVTKQFPDSRVVVIGPSRPVSIQIEALKLGARGYFDESMPLDKLDSALQLILHGEVWVERHVISGLIDELTHTPTLTDEQRHALDTLSPKELEVAKRVSHGATNKMIANAMNITERTVKAHLTAIFQKMNLVDRLSLAIFFRDLR